MKVLITGAAGLFGGILREHWGGAQTAPPNSDVDPRYALRLADVRPVGELPPPPQAVARISDSSKTVRRKSREGIVVFGFIADLNTLCNQWHFWACWA